MSRPPLLEQLLFAETPLPGLWTFFADGSVAPHTKFGPIQPTAFTCSWKLNDFGAGSVTIPVDWAGLEPEQLIRPYSWRLWAYYAGMPVWCGLPTGIEDTGVATVTVTLIELAGYLTKRQYDVTGGHVYTQVEQTTIAQQLAAPVADVGVAISTAAGPGFLRDRTYQYLEGQHRAELLTNLAAVLQGPEFRTEYGIAGGNPAGTLRIAYPRVGSAASGLGVTVPGNVVGYSGKWDGDEFRTRTFATGSLPQDAPQGAATPTIVIDRPQAGLPRLDRRDDWPDVILVSSLTQHANANATIYASPVFTVAGSPMESAPPITGYRVGDDVTINIVDPLLPGGLTTGGRLHELSIDAATGQTTWAVTTTVPPGKPRPSLAARLNRLDRNAQSLLRRNTAEVI